MIVDQGSIDALIKAHTTGDIFIVTLIGLLAWLGKMYVKRLDKHLEECGKRAVAHGQLEQRVCTMDEKLEKAESTMRWIGDGVVKIGAKLDIDLPGRPN